MGRVHERLQLLVRCFAAAVGFVAVALLASQPARAVPAFAGQTGQPCTTCHIGGFGPQLTPIGRAFKIGGYTRTGGEGWRAQVPLSLMALGSFSTTGSAVPAGNRVHRYAANSNANFDQASLLFAGGFGEHSGVFAQATTSNNASQTNLDNVDLRPYTTAFDAGDTELRIGTSLNNSPGVQDPYNTSYAWGYPFAGSALAPAPAAAPAIAGGMAGNVIGATAYLWYDSSLYLEAGGYGATNGWLNGRTGDAYGLGAARGAAPYLRAAYEWNWNDQSAHAGAQYFQATVNPAIDSWRTDARFGHNGYTDISLDGGYQYLGDGTHTVTVLGIFTREYQNLAGAAAAANTANGATYGSKYTLDQLRFATSYWYNNTYGVTLAWQGAWGKTNPVLYQPGPVDGSINGKPNNAAFILEADWVPFGKTDSWNTPLANLKLGAQYTAYTQFNGGTANYDGNGRNASDNNTLYLFAWLAF